MKMLKIAALGATLLASTMSFNTVAQAQGRLNAAVADWTGAVVTGRLLMTILEREYDYKINYIELPSGNATLEAIAGGDIDMGFEYWPSYNPAKGTWFEEWGGPGTVKIVGETGVIGKSSYYVPRYLVEGDDAAAKDLKHFSDLANYVDLFATVETGGKGRLIGCPALNWECDDQARADAYGVGFEAVVLGSETALWAEMQGAYKRQEPFVAYAWEPHWIHAELDLVALELDPYGDGSAWPKSGWAEDVTINYASERLFGKHDAALAMIANSRITNAQQAQMIYAVDVQGEEVQDVVDEWLANNEDIWRAWLQ